MSAGLIVSLDVAPEKARALVESLGERITIYKIGPVLWTSWGPACLPYFEKAGVKVFLDLKFHDIPNTVRETLAALLRCEGAGALWGLTLHCLGGYSMLLGARQVLEASPGPKPKLIGVTVLTSFREKDLFRVGINRSVEAQAKKQ
jgi:orotidine-5'-phosphate decarboxylase